VKQYPWRRVIKPSDIDIVAPDGTVRAHVQGYYAHTGEMIFVEDLSIDVQPGDEDDDYYQITKRKSSS
jgi:hypothetical protein